LRERASPADGFEQIDPLVNELLLDTKGGTPAARLEANRDAAAQQIVDAKRAAVEIQERTIRVVRALLRPEFSEPGHCRGGDEPTPRVPGGVVAAPSSRRHPDGSFLIHATRSVPPATVIGSPSNSGTFV